MQKINLKNLMGGAWTLAKHGSKAFGETPRVYFREALRIVWSESKKGNEVTLVYRPGVGSQYWLVQTRQEIRRGQLTLPGVLLN